MEVSNGSRPAQAFGPSMRLHHAWEYQKFFGPNRKKRYGPFVVYRLPNELGGARLGITVRGAPSAVVRNRLKRWTREAFRRHRGSVGAFDLNVVFSLRKPFERADLERFHELIEKEFAPRVLVP